MKTPREQLRRLTRAARADGRPRCPVSGKVRFRTVTLALAQLETTRNGERRAYPCRGCGDFHLTSKEPA